MAEKVLTMGAPPFNAFCGGCGREFRNRETMTAIKYTDGDPAGWHCLGCIALYEEWGRFDPDRAAQFANGGPVDG